MSLLSKVLNARSDAMLRAIQLERRRSLTDHIVAASQWMLVGAVIGGAIAILMTPTSGEELRNQINGKLTGARDKARDAAAKMRKRTTNARESTRARA